MSKKKAILRNLPSIESLSSTTTIITDKTGTITQNVMMIEQMMLQQNKLISISGIGWSNVGDFSLGGSTIDPTQDPELLRILEWTSIMSNGDLKEVEGELITTGYPTEVARSLLSQKAGINKVDLSSKFEVVDQKPYDQITKYKSYLIRTLNENEKFIVLIGGAEKVLELSTNAYDLNEYVSKEANNGYRLQAIAYKRTNKMVIDQEDLFDLNALAAYRFSDPIRPEVMHSIEQARNAGLRVIMATGDHVATAYSVAREVGIVPKNASVNEISTYSITQVEIDKLSDDEFREVVEKIDVYGRVTPATKLRIAEVLKEKGEVIAMTGDGVNDAPVLKKADIGIAMGLNGTDVAREASDLILMNDSFATIIEAIKEGRTVFRNIRQTSLFLITTNLAEDMMILIALLFGMPLPLVPIQILWLNLVTDGLPDVALASEKPHRDILDQDPIPIDTGIINRRDLKLLLIISMFMSVLAISFFISYYNVDIDKARSMAFTVMVFTQLFNVFNMRSLNLPIWKIGYLSNRALNIAVLISVVLFIGAMYTPKISELFSFTPLSLKELVVTFFTSSTVLLIGELYKYIRLNRSAGLKLLIEDDRR